MQNNLNKNYSLKELALSIIKACINNSSIELVENIIKACPQKNKALLLNYRYAGGDDGISETYEGFTPVFFAAHYNRMNILTCLLQHGALANVTIEKGQHSDLTPIEVAFTNQRPEMLSLLLDKGAELSPSILIHLFEAYPQYSKIIHAHLKKTDLGKLLIVDTYSKLPPLYNLFKCSNAIGKDLVIDIITSLNLNETMIKILDNDALNQLPEIFQDNQSCYLVALFQNPNKDDVMAFLNALHIDVTKNPTPLFIAACLGRNDLVLSIIEAGADIHAKIPEGEISAEQTALSVAIWNGKRIVIETLLTKGINLHEEVYLGEKNDQCTYISYAILSRQISSVFTLLRFGADLHQEIMSGENQGLNAWDFVLRTGQLDLFRLLLTKGHKLNLNRVITHGPFIHHDLIQLVLLSNNITLVTQLIVSIFPEYKDNSKKINNVILNKWVLLKEYNNIKKAIANGLDLNEKSRTSCESPIENTPLTTAVCQKDLKMVKLLIDNGATCITNEPEDHSPFSNALFNAIPEMVDYFLENTPQLIHQEGSSGLPLSQVIRQGAIDLIPILAKHGANLNYAPDNMDLYNPLLYCVHTNQIEMAKQLIKYGASLDFVIQHGVFKDKKVIDIIPNLLLTQQTHDTNIETSLTINNLNNSTFTKSHSIEPQSDIEEIALTTIQSEMQALAINDVSKDNECHLKKNALTHPASFFKRNKRIPLSDFWDKFYQEVMNKEYKNLFNISKKFSKEKDTNDLSYYTIAFHLLRLGEAALQYIENQSAPNLYSKENRSASFIRNGVMHFFFDIEQNELINIAYAITNQPAFKLDALNHVLDTTGYQQLNESVKNFEQYNQDQSKLTHNIQSAIKKLAIYYKMTEKNSKRYDYIHASKMLFTLIGENYRLLTSNSIDTILQNFSPEKQKNLSLFFKRCKEIRNTIGHQFTDTPKSVSDIASTTIGVYDILSLLKTASWINKGFVAENENQSHFTTSF